MEKFSFKDLKKEVEIAFSRNKEIKATKISPKTLRLRQKYFLKEASTTVLIIKDEFQNKDLKVLIKIVFLKGFHYITSNSWKHRSFMNSTQ